ncbi:hypothetical protein RclHR1_00920004 [Rhizophagus clarus]|nr:hypothetical protein RclHR1_00920004 [Rhizophagus clarus]
MENFQSNGLPDDNNLTILNENDYNMIPFNFDDLQSNSYSNSVTVSVEQISNDNFHNHQQLQLYDDNTVDITDQQFLQQSFVFSPTQELSSTTTSMSYPSTTPVCENPKRIPWNKNTSRKLSSGGITRRCTWCDEMDRCLLLYLEENKDKVEKLKNNRSGVKVELWCGASEWMFTYGCDYSPEQCYNRWKNIKQNYTSGILNERKNPAQYKSVERILAGYGISLNGRDKRKMSDEEAKPKVKELEIIYENPEDQERKGKKKRKI